VIDTKQNKEHKSLTEKITQMDDIKFDKWLKINGYSGMAAVRLSHKRRESLKNQGLFV
jgi:hypothetical protein